jgi:hypothetical protein
MSPGNNLILLALSIRLLKCVNMNSIPQHKDTSRNGSIPTIDIEMIRNSPGIAEESPRYILAAKEVKKKRWQPIHISTNRHQNLFMNFVKLREKCQILMINIFMDWRLSWIEPNQDIQDTREEWFNILDEKGLLLLL